IIDPSGFTFLCSEYKNKGKNSVSSDTALEPIEPLYISTDENLMYAPTEADIVLDKVGKIYELPEYICMNPENPTVFTIIYDLKNYDRIRRFVYKDSNENVPYYSSGDSPQKNWDVWETIKDWDIWEEKELES
ncbi:MAG: hypothetical protein K2K34_05675, partial [Oscillospiraceae bacterium]|nr:hypothetical protein [Oscillospiraceae bacterium]